jgi:hypothetical protein
MVRQYRDGLLASAEYMRMKKVIREQEYLQASYLRGQGPMQAAAPLQKKIILLGKLQKAV